MRPSALRDRLSEGLLEFTWNEWAQMGLLAQARRPSRWAQDPEALIVFTLEVARDDPRLFDELLDWLLVNESLLSARRLRAVCRGAEDERLVDAALGWVDRRRPRARRVSHVETGTPVPLFRGVTTRARRRDPAFATAGWLRPPVEPSGKARRPELHAPINLAFRLRELLGVGARAEVVRFLLTVNSPSVQARVVSESACFAKRNVHEALTSLHAAGAVRRWTVGNEQRYEIDREAWARLLEITPGELPTERSWPQLLAGLRAVLRWLSRPDLDGLSDYLRASQARDLLEAVRRDFEYAGLRVSTSLADGAWDDLEALVADALGGLGRPAASFEQKTHDLGAGVDASSVADAIETLDGPTAR